jgi:hypothetical protein
MAIAEVESSNCSCPTERVNITYQGRPVVFRLDATVQTLAKGTPHARDSAEAAKLWGVFAYLVDVSHGKPLKGWI